VTLGQAKGYQIYSLYVLILLLLLLSAMYCLKACKGSCAPDQLTDCVKWRTICAEDCKSLPLLLLLLPVADWV